MGVPQKTYRVFFAYVPGCLNPVKKVEHRCFMSIENRTGTEKISFDHCSEGRCIDYG